MTGSTQLTHNRSRDRVRGCQMTFRVQHNDCTRELGMRESEHGSGRRGLHPELTSTEPRDERYQTSRSLSSEMQHSIPDPARRTGSDRRMERASGCGHESSKLETPGGVETRRSFVLLAYQSWARLRWGCTEAGMARSVLSCTGWLRWS